jgi:hypothetical protein
VIIRQPRRKFVVLSWLGALLAGSVLGLGARLILFVGAIVLVRAVSVAARALVESMPWVDPVYTGAVVRSLGEVQLQGVAVGGPPGQWLHGALPWLVVDPARAHMALARVVLQPGSGLLGRLVAAALAHAGVLCLGVVLASIGWRRRRVPLLLTGLAVQMQVAVSILGAQPSVRELEATGLSFAANALLPWLWQRGVAFGDALSGAPRPLLAACLVGVALMHGYIPAAVLVALRRRARMFTLGSACVFVLMTAACAGALQAATVAQPAAPIVHTSFEPAAPMLQPIAARGGMPEPVAHLGLSDRWFDESAPGPSHVEVLGAQYNYQLLVNGRPEVIKGMGLNTQYTQFLTPDQRVERLDADMTAYREVGVNTVLGWDPREFDSTLLDAAQRHGVGVIMPFELDPEADYSDPELRQHLHDDALAWVVRYRDHPALRMWGLGNEVLHKIVHPAWVGPQDPRRELNAAAFSDWLIETADAIHALDPNHPVTYRSAEDAFVPWVVAALRRHGGGPRPWFVWGTNCYQDYLAQILDNWPESGLDAALWVSEFAPGTLAVPDRPDGFRTMWGYIRAHPTSVLGGAVYAWTRNGPEGVDRNFGLTDDGVPVDGRSLDMLGDLFHATR